MNSLHIQNSIKGERGSLFYCSLSTPSPDKDTWSRVLPQFVQPYAVVSFSPVPSISDEVFHGHSPYLPSLFHDKQKKPYLVLQLQQARLVLRASWSLPFCLAAPTDLLSAGACSCYQQSSPHRQHWRGREQAWRQLSRVQWTWAKPHIFQGS